MSKDSKTKKKNELSPQESERLTQSKEVTPVTTSPHAEDHPDFAEFVQICKMTGTMGEEYQNLSAEDKAKFDVGFRQWLKLGKPKPTMPELPKAKVAGVVDLWRVRARQQEWIYYDTTAGKKEGVEQKNGKIVKYTIPYTTTKVQELLKEREQVTDIDQPVHCYIVFDGKPHTIQEEDMLKPFDQVVKNLKTGQIAS